MITYGRFKTCVGDAARSPSDMLSVLSTLVPVGRSAKNCGTPEAMKLETPLPKLLNTPPTKLATSSPRSRCASSRFGAGVIIGWAGTAMAAGKSPSKAKAPSRAMIGQDTVEVEGEGRRQQRRQRIIIFPSKLESPTERASERMGGRREVLEVACPSLPSTRSLFNAMQV